MTMKQLHTPSNRRRGMAIELAITVLMIVFALGTVLVTTALMQNNNRNQLRNTAEQSFALDRLGEQFCIAVKNGEDLTAWAQSVEEFTATVQQDAENTQLLLQQDENTVLRVVLQSENGQHTVTAWEYR